MHSLLNKILALCVVPAYIKQLSDYSEVTAKSEGKQTGFCDWSHPELQTFVIQFYSELAKQFDNDRRLAFLQTGFGLWAEYHIYDGPLELGKTFPSRDFQARFAKHLDVTFKQLPWMIGDDQAKYQSLDRIREAGMQCGYKFHVEKIESNGTETRGTITNRGVAPIYFDAYPAILQSGSEVRSTVSLKYLLPGEQRQFTILGKADTSNFRIACDRLVEGQHIPFTSN